MGRMCPCRVCDRSCYAGARADTLATMLADLAVFMFWCLLVGVFLIFVALAVVEWVRYAMRQRG